MCDRGSCRSIEWLYNGRGRRKYMAASALLGSWGIDEVLGEGVE